MSTGSRTRLPSVRNALLDDATHAPTVNGAFSLQLPQRSLVYTVRTTVTGYIDAVQLVLVNVLHVAISFQISPRLNYGLHASRFAIV